MPESNPDPSASSTGRLPSLAGTPDGEIGRAGDDRDALEAIRARYQARIARRSDDFEATRGLKHVEAALNRTTRADDPWDRAVRKLVKD